MRRKKFGVLALEDLKQQLGFLLSPLMAGQTAPDGAGFTRRTPASAQYPLFDFARNLSQFASASASDLFRAKVPGGSLTEQNQAKA
jgi:hypothetical protein